MKKISSACLAMLCFLGAHSLEVDRAEITPGQNAQTVEFINYTGPASYFSSAADDRRRSGIVDEQELQPQAIRTAITLCMQ